MRDAVEADMVETELIPCPFCGNTSTREKPIHVHHDEDDDVVYVFCEGCEAKGPIVIVRYYQITDAIDRAERKWNQRQAAQ